MSKYNNSAILNLDIDIFKELIKNSKTWKEVMLYFVENHGYKATYSNITLKKRCIREGIDFSHFKVSTIIKYNDNNLIMIKNTKSRIIKKKLLKDKILEEICSICGLGTTWQGKPISLQLEHIDGNHFNNEISNLTLLCPNCHSQTDTWCGRNVNKNKCINCDKIIKKDSTRCTKCHFSDLSNIRYENKLKKLKTKLDEKVNVIIELKKELDKELQKSNNKKKLDIEYKLTQIFKVEEIEETEVEENEENEENEESKIEHKLEPRVKQCPECGEGITKRATYCIDCAHKQSRKVTRPSLEQIMDDLKELKSNRAVGRKYGVSDSTIKKWIKAYQKEAK